MKGSRVGAVVAIFLGLVALTGCSTPNFEQSCTPDFNGKPDTACPYGPPGGPQVRETPCVLKVNTQSGCGVSWNQVFNGVFSPVDHGNCSAAGCHGDPKTAGFGLVLPAN